MLSVFKYSYIFIFIICSSVDQGSFTDSNSTNTKIHSDAKET